MNIKQIKYMQRKTAEEDVAVVCQDMSGCIHIQHAF